MAFSIKINHFKTSFYLSIRNLLNVVRDKNLWEAGEDDDRAMSIVNMNGSPSVTIQPGSGSMKARISASRSVSQQLPGCLVG